MIKSGVILVFVFLAVAMVKLDSKCECGGMFGMRRESAGMGRDRRGFSERQSRR